MPDEQTATSWLARAGFAVGAGAIGGVCIASARYWSRVSAARQQLQHLIAANAGGNLRIVITGATTGIGKELAQQFARNPSVSLLVGCRDVARGERIFGNTSNCKVVPLELLDFDSVRSFSNEVHTFLSNGSDEGVRMLINNAGVMRPPPSKLCKDIDPTWQTNFLAPFLITELVARQRISSKISSKTDWPVRAINVTSRLERRSKLDLELLESVQCGEVGKKSYSDSKRALMLWMSVRSASMSSESNLFMHATTPGMVSSELGRYSMQPWLWPLTWPLRAFMLRSCAEAALGIAEAGLSKQATECSGRYMDGSKQLEDLIVGRVGEKVLADTLVAWATQATGLETRAAGDQH